MNTQDAISIVERWILEEHPDCALLEKTTVEYGSCFVFYYQSKMYIESKNISDMCVGQGPVIVCRKTGDVFQTSSSGTEEHYVRAFEACNDPLGTPTSVISISSWDYGASAVRAIKCLQLSSGQGLAHAKSKIDQVLHGECAVVELSSIDIVEATINSLLECGFRSRQLWSNQC